MRNADLRDRLYREMVDSDRDWQADEIARFALKIVSDVRRARPLVQAILGADPRFVVRDGAWRARQQSAPALDEFPILLCETVPAGAAGAPPALIAEAWEPKRGRASDPILVMPDGGGVDGVAEMLEGTIAASLGAPAARRALHRLERLYALPSTSERMIDLAAALRAAGERPPSPPASDGDATIESILAAGREALRVVLAVYGPGSLDALEDAVEAHAAATPVDFSLFRFDRESLDAIPSRPGVYRFLGEEDRLLYVGKSRDLHRRLSEYFRPLAPDHRRRAGLLGEIRDLRWETCPSELEALIVESISIRTHHPPYNRQIDIHPDPADGDPEEGDLAFVLCEGDPDQVSAFLLRAGEPWGWGRLSRASAEAARADGENLLDCWGRGGEDLDRGVRRCGPEEASLIRRYLRLFGDRIDRVEHDALQQPAHALAALIALCLRERPAWDPWTLRARIDS